MLPDASTSMALAAPAHADMGESEDDDDDDDDDAGAEGEESGAERRDEGRPELRRGAGLHFSTNGEQKMRLPHCPLREGSS